jgi:hypothetical protein
MRTSRQEKLDIIEAYSTGDLADNISGWEIKILLLPFLSDQQIIIELHAFLEKRITDKENKESELDFYNTLEYAISRNLDLTDVYQY